MWARQDPSALLRVRQSTMDTVRAYAKVAKVPMTQAMEEIMTQWNGMRTHQCVDTHECLECEKSHIDECPYCEAWHRSDHDGI
jgi:hypothetical protein